MIDVDWLAADATPLEIGVALFHQWAEVLTRNADLNYCMWGAIDDLERLAEEAAAED